MTTYRVGEQGATVFDEHGRAITWLKPGSTVVPGSTELEGTAAAVADDAIKRMRGYADKRLAAERDLADKGA